MSGRGSHKLLTVRVRGGGGSPPQLSIVVLSSLGTWVEEEGGGRERVAIPMGGGGLDHFGEGTPVVVVMLVSISSSISSSSTSTSMIQFNLGKLRSNRIINLQHILDTNESKTRLWSKSRAMFWNVPNHLKLVKMKGKPLCHLMVRSSLLLVLLLLLLLLLLLPPGQEGDVEAPLPLTRHRLQTKMLLGKIEPFF